MTEYHLYVYQSVKSMSLPIGVLRSMEAESNCAVTHPTLTFHCIVNLCVPFVKLFCFTFCMLFYVSLGIFVMYVRVP
jgi:hypothetical protein